MKLAGRLEGWPLTLALSAAIAGMALALLAVHGWSEEGVRSIVRLTARTSVALFALAFGASSLVVLWPGTVSKALLRNRRHLGVAFAVSHYGHLAALVALGGAFPEPFVSGLNAVTLVGGGLAYLFIAAMALTSTDAAQARMGVWWKRLHKTGSWYVWILFAQSYLPRAVVAPAYLPLAALVVAAAALRIWVFAQHARKRAPAAA